MRFTVPGPPVPWQRVAAGHVPPKTRAYKKHVGVCALAARAREAQWPLRLGVFAVGIVICRVPGRGKQRRGDVDNYAKGILDALSGVLFEDDSQVRRLVVDIVDCEPGRERAIVTAEECAVAREVQGTAIIVPEDMGRRPFAVPVEEARRATS